MDIDIPSPLPLPATSSHLPSPTLTPVEEDAPSLIHDLRSRVPGLDEHHDDESACVNGHEDVSMNSPRLSGTKDRAHSTPAHDSFSPKEGFNELRGRSSTTETANIAPPLLPPVVRKLSAARIQELTSSPDSLPLRSAPILTRDESYEILRSDRLNNFGKRIRRRKSSDSLSDGKESFVQRKSKESSFSTSRADASLNNGSIRPRHLSRATSTPPPEKIRTALPRLESERVSQDEPGLSWKRPSDDKPEERARRRLNGTTQVTQSSTPPLSGHLPLPPLSMPTFLQLELSTERPSPLYLKPAAEEYPYESSKVKFDRLLNFLLLPPHLEQTILFGALACLDAWLYTITILPLRFINSLWMLVHWLFRNAIAELIDISLFIYRGIGRLWTRHRRSAEVPPLGSKHGKVATPIDAPEQISETGSKSGLVTSTVSPANTSNRGVTLVSRTSSSFTHRRTKSRVSLLRPNHKADILQGLLIIGCSTILMRFDASRMYHIVRGQSAIKLYVIYNGLEVCDRLFSALGQDIMECLFSRETLERMPNGRSKVIRPTWMFLLALAYCVIHATALLYQVVTLHVAVNAYSNALLTLLISNQFVEIKGSVFKRIEKENLFQLTCADVVERFQLWIMLLIIAMRNVVEMGGLTLNATGNLGAASPSAATTSTNSSDYMSQLVNILPHSFTFLPSFPAHVFAPFLIVLGSEMLVDWLKHAYINKFNAISPKVYGRFLDVLAKDYYSNAFAEQTLTKRLGLPVIPLCCLFIRAALQAYHMFLVINVPSPITSTSTSLSVESGVSAPSSTAVFARMDLKFREALGRSTFGGASVATSGANWYSWTMDDAIALSTMAIVFLVLYLFLLALKLVMGISLLSFARGRYRGMRAREQQRVVEPEAKRHGQWAVVEVPEDKRRWIYEGDAEGLARMRARDAKAHAQAQGKAASQAGDRLEKVDRYSMVAKRIW